MAKTRYIHITEYCRICNLEPAFILELHHHDLIELTLDAGEQRGNYLDENELPRIERFARLHQDLEINTAGLEAVAHLLDKVERLQEEVRLLKNQVDRP